MTAHRRSRFSLLRARIMKSETAQAVAAWLVTQYLWVVFRTTAWTYHGLEEARSAVRSDRRTIFVMWHNRIAMMPFALRDKDISLVALVSNHRDGRLINRVLESCGVDRVTVPANELGLREVSVETALRARVARETRDHLERGAAIAMAADGPVGPRHVVKQEPVNLARFCRAELMVAAYSIRRRVVLRSWDRLIIPLPFGRGAFVCSPRRFVPSDAPAEEMRAAVEAELLSVTERADRAVGLTAGELTEVERARASIRA